MLRRVCIVLPRKSLAENFGNSCYLGMALELLATEIFTTYSTW